MVTQEPLTETGICQICGQEKKTNEMIPATMIRKSILAVIKKEHPGWTESGYICADDYRHYRDEHIQEILEMERGVTCSN